MSTHFISRYLNVIDLGGSVLLFNGVNGCLDEVTGKAAEVFKSGQDLRLEELGEKNMLSLLNRGHITLLPPEEELARFTAFSAALHKKQEANPPGLAG